jgi:hypothetical protein
MIPVRRPGRRLGLAAVLAALALLLGGCVYLRLLELKRQLADFDRHFALHTADGLALDLKHPVLLADDVRWLGLVPEQIRAAGDAEEWQVRWVKQLPVGVLEPRRYDLVVDLTFKAGKLARVVVPERYFAVLPKAFLADVIRSVGRARVDRPAAAVESDVAATRPELRAIDELLGRPSEERESGPQTIFRYRYLSATGDPRAGSLDMTLVFDTASGRLLHWQGRTPVGQLGFRFTAPVSP